MDEFGLVDHHRVREMPGHEDAIELVVRIQPGRPFDLVPVAAGCVHETAQADIVEEFAAADMVVRVVVGHCLIQIARDDGTAKVAIDEGPKLREERISPPRLALACACFEIRSQVLLGNLRRAGVNADQPHPPVAAAKPGGRGVGSQRPERPSSVRALDVNREIAAH